MDKSDRLQGAGAPARFRDRKEAGQLLAGILREHVGRGDAVVLGIPRGGLPVATEVARTLALPLDVLVVQKITLGAHSAWQEPPVAGALAREGTRLVEIRNFASTGAQPEELEQAITAGQKELAQREIAYRDGCPFPDVQGKIVVLVDDGIESGITMRTAIAALRALRPARIIAAVPVGSAPVCQEIGELADAVVCPVRLPQIAPIHSRYDDFPKVTDEEVRALIEYEIHHGALPCPPGGYRA